MLIYKICSREAWQEATVAGEFTGAEIDLQDGFIHFSAADQARETAAKHFRGQPNLVLVGVEAERLGDALKWEVSRGGAEFPHLYSALNVALVSSVDELPLNAEGQHEFPDSIA